MSVDAINKKLQQEEEWLKNFEANVGRSRQLCEGLVAILDKFSSRLQLLEDDVMSKHEKNGRLQKRQQNIQKLIRTVDSTIQFYGKTGDVESKIRDNLPSSDLEAYLDSMECLQQAIQFFEKQSEKRIQIENMKMTLEAGYSSLEREFRVVVADSALKPDAVTLVDSLDENAELLIGRAKTLATMKNIDKVAKIASWLLAKGRDARFLAHYSENRGENMRQILAAVLEQQQQRLSAGLRAHKIIPKRIARSERAEKEPRSLLISNDEAQTALVLFGAFLTLIEETIMEKILSDVALRAQVHRELVAKPLALCVRVASGVVASVDSLPSLLPLLRYLSVHYNQLQTLSLNAGQEQAFEGLMRSLRVKCTSLLNESVERLRNDTDKFVPEDGNVHPLTANLKAIFIDSDIIVRADKLQTDCDSANLSPIIGITCQYSFANAEAIWFAACLVNISAARILSALGTCLQRKSELYSDSVLSTVFLLNNYNHIAKSLQDEEDALLPVISEQNHQILEFYLSQIAAFEQSFLSAWQSVVSALASAERAHDKFAITAAIQNFNREFESQISQQKNYCISDKIKADQVRAKVKAMLVDRYSRLVERCVAEGCEQKAIRYSGPSLGAIIDRLFETTA